MLTQRIIACLDVRDGRVVKGTRFVNLRDAGDPVVLAERYEVQGADEIVYLDIAATDEARGTLLDLVRRTAERLFIPLTVAGGMRTVDDIELISGGSRAVRVPVIASGGAGSARDVADAFVLGGADAALLAGVLHDGTTEIATVKSALRAARILVRMAA